MNIPNKALEIANELGFSIEAAQYHWGGFVNYATNRGISVENEEDWLPWWDCWIAGADEETLRGGQP